MHALIIFIVKKESMRLYAIRTLKKCRLTARQLILVYCSIIRSDVLEYVSPVKAGLTQYLSDQIESMQKTALKIIFPSLCYEDALKKSGLILLRQEGGCMHNISQAKLLFFQPATKLSAVSCAHKTDALRTGKSVSVPVSSRTNRFGNFCTIKYHNHV